MNTGKSAFLLILACSLLLACDKSEIEFENDYEKSYNAWLQFKASANNSYKYVVFSSTSEAIAWESGITVLNGRVIQRDFRYTDGFENLLEVELEWTEDENQLGTHEDRRGADLLTLDEVYDKTRHEWLTKRAGAESYFETKNDGLISAAGYYIVGCSDDCSTGINIIHIAAL